MVCNLLLLLTAAGLAREQKEAADALLTCVTNITGWVSRHLLVVILIADVSLGSKPHRSTAYLLFADTLNRRVSAESPQGLLGKGPQTVIRSYECGRALRPPVLSILHHSSL